MDDNQNDNSNSNGGGFGEVKEREELDDNDDATQGEQSDGDQGDSGDNDQGEADDQQNQDGTDQNQDDQNQDSQQTTEKGTKLDKNPKSAVHQQLANEKRMRGQMEQVLADPKLIARFVKEQYGADLVLPGQQTQTTDKPAEDNQNGQATTKKWTAKDFESLEDVAEKFNGLQDQFTSEIQKRDKEIGDLKKELGGFSQKNQLVEIADGIETDVKALRENPELDPNSPDYVEGLEEKIGGMFRALDFDKTTGSYRGQHSIREIGEQIISAARIARKAGVQRGQTIVKDKTKGQVRTTSTASEQVDTSKVSAGQSIAQGVAKMFKN